MGRTDVQARTGSRVRAAIFEPLEARRLLSATVVADIVPGVGGSYPGKVHEVGGLNLFAASDNVHGFELWRTDGTAAGTRMVKDLVPGVIGSVPDSFVAFNGAAYFLADNALWRTDGTEGGTFIVQDDPGVRYFGSPRALTAFNGALYFWDQHAKTGAARLWRSDGAANGLARLLPVGRQPTTADAKAVGQFMAFGDALLFSYADGLWRTDGTQGATSQIAPVRVGGNLHRFGDAMMFMGQFRGRTGIWRTDGTTAGTWTVKDLHAGEIPADAGLGVVHGQTLDFAAKDAIHGTELWKTDGTADGTVMIADILPASPPVDDGYGYRPAGIDDAMAWPAAANANLIVRVNFPDPPPPSDSAPSNFHVVGNHVVFTAVTKQNDLFYRTLYRTDGTADGTVQVADLGYRRSSSSGSLSGGTIRSSYASAIQSAFDDFERFDGMLFFTVNTDLYERKILYVTDGTAVGTRLVHYTWGEDFPNIGSLSAVGGSLYFASSSVEFGEELFRWDHTGGITGFAYDDANGNGVRDPSELPLVGWRVFLDRNGDGVFNRGEKFTFADQNGAYGFPAYPDGEYTVHVTPTEDGWTAPAVSAPVGRGRTTWRDVSAARVTPAYGSVSGNVFKDADFDGAFDGSKGDGPREGVRVYLDLNRNGYYTPGEPQTFSNAKGDYRFDDVLPGYYRLAVVDLGDGHEYTRGLERMLLVRPNRSPAVDFGIGYDGSDGVIRGTVFDDRDGDGIHDRKESGIPGTVLYLDKNGDRRLNPGEDSQSTDSLGFFKFAGLRRGTHRLRQVAAPDAMRRLTTDPLRMFSLPVAGSGTMSFGYESAGTVSGHVFNDVNGNGFPKAAAGEFGLAGWTVYSDLNNDGQRSGEEPMTASRADGFFELKHLKPGRHRLRVVPRYDSTGWLPTTPAAHLSVSLAAGEALERSIGIAAGGAVTGSIFHDLNYDRVRQDDEPGVAGISITLTRTLFASPSPRTVPSVTTAADGSFRFEGVYQGSWQLAPTLGDGWQYFLTNSTVIVSESAHSSIDLIAARKTPQVVGPLFKDINGNGQIDFGEARLPGYVVYVDEDEDGRLDANEPKFTSNERGVFYFADLTPGPTTFRYVPQAGDGLAGRSMLVDVPQAAANLPFTLFGARLKG